MGIDPTRHRPSSEALVRRILQGRDLYRVNTAVDAANLASITHFRPVGLYDADRISADESSGPAGRAVRTVTLRLGREGESYPGINKDRISVFGRPTLVDREGPFGNPSSDSDRTRITMQTCRLLFVLFEPIDETGDSIRAHLDASLETLRRFTGELRRLERWAKFPSSDRVGAVKPACWTSARSMAAAFAAQTCGIDAGRECQGDEVQGRQCRSRLLESETG